MHLVITCVEKSFLAATKFADTVLDCGLNEAVPPEYYHFRPLRLRMTDALSRCLTQPDRKRFWEAYLRRDLGAFAEVADTVGRRLGKSRRGSEWGNVLSSALDWAYQHPGAVLTDCRNEYDSPNIVAFSLLVNRLGDLSDQLGFRVVRFVHDEQNEFAQFIQTMFELRRNLVFAMHPTAWAHEVRTVDTISASVQFRQSHDSPALQLVDILLWLARRRFERADTPIPSTCAQLLHWIGARTDFLPFIEADLRSEVKACDRLVRRLLSNQRAKKRR